MEGLWWRRGLIWRPRTGSKQTASVCIVYTCTEDPHENHPSIVLGLPPPPTAIHCGPQATWMSLEAHPRPTVEGACGMLNAKTSRNLACGIGCYSP